MLRLFGEKSWVGLEPLLSYYLVLLLEGLCGFCYLRYLFDFRIKCIYNGSNFFDIIVYS